MEKCLNHDMSKSIEIPWFKVQLASNFSSKLLIRLFCFTFFSHASADTHGKERQLLAFLSHSLFGLTAFSASDSACETPATAKRTTTTA